MKSLPVLIFVTCSSQVLAIYIFLNIEVINCCSMDVIMYHWPNNQGWGPVLKL